MGFVPGKHRRKEIKNALNLRLFDNLWSGFELRFGFAYLLEGWLHGVELILGMVNMLLRSYLRLVAAGVAFIHKEWLHGVAFILRSGYMVLRSYLRSGCMVLRSY